MNLLIATLNDQWPTCHLALRVTNSNNPVQTAVTDPLVTITQASLAKIWGQPALALGTSSGTDASEYLRANPKMPVIVVGPGNETAHAINEFVWEDDYLKSIELYQMICREYFKK